MADPFSIIAGTAGLADVCIRVTKFLKHAKEGFQTVDADLEALFEEIASLRAVNDLIQRSYKEGLTISTEPDHQQIFDSHWRATEATVSGCQRIIEQIEGLLTEVLNVGSGRHIKLDQLRKWLKQQSREEALNALRNKLKAHQIALQTSLTAVNMSVITLYVTGLPEITEVRIYSRSSQATSNKSHSELTRSIQDLGADLESEINSLKGLIHLSTERALEPTLQSAQEVVPLALLNKHFYTPQAVSSIFTGRESELEILKHHLVDVSSTNPHQAQKRFIILGLSGSGKTQFCCKFASDNKQSFWGVFWIDASTKANAEQSFSTISSIGRVAATQAAVKSWLSSLGREQRWLLIIDNADERDFPVEDCFPDGNVGTVLVTTRNPMLKTLGTVGPRYFQFEELEEAKSVELLLNAANESVPWIPASVTLARNIANALGCLPLALIHAGKTILARLCTLETYLDFFEKSWARISRSKEVKATSSSSDTNATIYSTYELIYESISTRNTQASEDALELLKIFPFLHRQRIRLDIFLRAASNPKAELLDGRVREQEEKSFGTRSTPKLTWAQALKNLAIRIHGLLTKHSIRPVLPQFLAGTPGGADFDETRLRQGLKELFQMSLISSSSDSEECYLMHPAVHLWARKRPEMTLVEQAVWCQVTANILSQAILLPPLGDTEEDENFRRDILPHVYHVHQVERAIQSAFAKNQESRRKLWPVVQPRLNRDRALQLIKFSVVYLQAGLFKEAGDLQLYVADFAIRTIGIEQPATMDVMLLLSTTYWLQARAEEAAELRRQIVDASTRVLGKNHRKTLKFMDAYGSSLWQQGRVPEARKLHEGVVQGLQAGVGSDHIDTLKAMGNLGRAVGKDFDFAEAISIHAKAYEGLKAQLGPAHLETLVSMDNLAMAYFDRAAYRCGQPGDLDQAADLQSKVFAMRKEKLGREHLFTLWSGLNLSRIWAIRGEIDEALVTFLPGHAIARRDLGETHFGYLLGELHYGRILMCAKRYEEAEVILSKLVHTHEEARKRHPDRLLAMLSLIKCRNVLGKEDETTELFQELTESTRALFGPEHMAVKYLLDPQTLSKDTSDTLDLSQN